MDVHAGGVVAGQVADQFEAARQQDEGDPARAAWCDAFARSRPTGGRGLGGAGGLSDLAVTAGRTASHDLIGGQPDVTSGAAQRHRRSASRRRVNSSSSISPLAKRSLRMRSASWCSERPAGGPLSVSRAKPRHDHGGDRGPKHEHHQTHREPGAPTPTHRHSIDPSWPPRGPPCPRQAGAPRGERHHQTSASSGSPSPSASEQLAAGALRCPAWLPACNPPVN